MLAANLVMAGVLLGVSGIGVLANETTHGGFVDTIGLGHHHLADYGGYHCTSHRGDLGERHIQHMHNETLSQHNACPGGATMHKGGMMRA